MLGCLGALSRACRGLKVVAGSLRPTCEPDYALATVTQSQGRASVNRCVLRSRFCGSNRSSSIISTLARCLFPISQSHSCVRSVGTHIRSIDDETGASSEFHRKPSGTSAKSLQLPEQIAVRCRSVTAAICELALCGGHCGPCASSRSRQTLHAPLLPTNVALTPLFRLHKVLPSMGPHYP